MLHLRSCWDPPTFVDAVFERVTAVLGSANRQFEASTVPVEHYTVGHDRRDDSFTNAIALMQTVTIENDEALRRIFIPHVHAQLQWRKSPAFLDGQIGQAEDPAGSGC